MYPCDKYFFIDKLSMEHQILAYPFWYIQVWLWNARTFGSSEESEWVRKSEWRWKVCGMRKSTKNWHIPNYTLSSSYSRLKQIWFPHTHIHTEKEFFIDCRKKSSPLYRIFSALSFRRFPLFENYFGTLNFTEFNPNLRYHDPLSTPVLVETFFNDERRNFSLFELFFTFY